MFSGIWYNLQNALDPDDSTYVEVPCSRQERPAISLYEHRLAVAHLRAQEQAAVDEDAIFRAVQQQRKIVHGAAQRTRSARRQVARTADAARSALARKTSAPPVLPDNAIMLGGTRTARGEFLDLLR